MAFTKDQIRTGQSAQRKYSEVDGYRLQSLTEGEKVSLEALWNRQYQKIKDVPPTHRRALLVRSIVDDAGARVFEDNEVAMLEDWDAQTVSKLYEVARILSGFDPGNVEAYLKNFGPPIAGE